MLRKTEDNYIDLIYCDILYGTGKKFKDYKDIKADRKTIEDFYIPRIQEMHRVLKVTGSIFLHMDWRICHWVRCIMDDIFGYENFKNEIIWCYGAGGSPKQRYATKHDNILFYTKTDTYTWNEQYNEYKSRMKDYWNIKSIADMSGCLNYGYTDEYLYFSQKPESLLERIIYGSSNEGDIVADFFCGSGTALVVAKKMGRNYIGCDINNRAVDIANKRLLI